MPNNIKIRIVGVRSNEEDYAFAKPGENVELRIVGVDEEQLRKGCVISSISNPVPVCTVFEAQMVIVELLEHRPLLTSGYKCSECRSQSFSRIIAMLVRAPVQMCFFLSNVLSVICLFIFVN